MSDPNPFLTSHGFPTGSSLECKNGAATPYLQITDSIGTSRALKQRIKKKRRGETRQGQTGMTAASARNLLNEHELKLSTHVTLEHRRSHKQHRYIWSNSQQYIVWVKIIHFYCMPKIIRILRSCSMKIFSTVNISKPNLLLICIAVNFI